MKIIGVSGRKGSGKDTVSNFLVESEKFIKVSFASTLKNLCARVFDIEDHYFENERLKETELDYTVTVEHFHIDKIERIVKEEWGFDVDYLAQHAFVDYVGVEFKKPRQILQTVGDMLRNNIRDDIFIVMLFSKIKEIDGNVVISDVRYQNEREALKKAGASLIIVKRDALNEKDSHRSENDFGKDSDYDAVINNNDISLGVLRSEVLMWYSVAVKYK